MEAGGKDCEEETLQTAFKKLRVDAESVPGAASVSEALTPRAASRVCLDSSGAKAKLGCPKDNWHCCVRKTSRGGSSRSQRRRRSKSPILHPPKFTYCSSSALSPPAGCLKHQRLSLSESAEPHPAGDEKSGSPAAPPVQSEPSSSGTPGCVSPLLFGVSPGYEASVRGAVSSPSLPEITTAAVSPRWDRERSGGVRSFCDGAEDFRSLSELHSSAEGPACSCTPSGTSDPQEEGGQEAGAQCSCRSHHQGWSGMEVYSFTGLRSVISECEGSLPSHDDAPRTVSAHSSSSSSSGSPRSCSEQARAYVDDITIEDLSGYMEYYLYIPKKMSHMAEMMYT
ncbi:oxidative stress-responsive serine-rich protein 1 isoform X1 [Kryptolebias marmoratus]|uniref:Oxidative stress-responsive serine-rich protein 1 n=1 Tax=Kryptolebias marmoratus TaxID=37003 RepID=A0A3Q3AQD0_KRYMA|nr:oxidative stress-responsive serine-rich protein 1 isoform X1 [Kryptolebias marmoratus]